MDDWMLPFFLMLDAKDGKRDSATRIAASIKEKNDRRHPASDFSCDAVRDLPSRNDIFFPDREGSHDTRNSADKAAIQIMFEIRTACYRDWLRDAGFTLVELMITLAVAGVLLAIAVPSFNQMIVATRLATQANEIVAAVSLARSEAIKRNASITFCRVKKANDTNCDNAVGNWQNWIVRTGDGTGAGTIVQRGIVNTYGGTFVVTSTLDTDRVLFGSDGLARTGSAIIASDAKNNVIRLCSTRLDKNNVRLVALGAGSRVSTTIKDEKC